MSIKAYCTESFINGIFSKPVDFYNFDAADSNSARIAWAQLIVNNLTLLFDEETEALNEKIKNNRLLLALVKKDASRVAAAKVQHNSLCGTPAEFFFQEKNSAHLFPLFLRDDVDFAKEFGYTFCKSTDQNFSYDKVFLNKREQFKFKENIDWKKAMSCISYHHSTVLIDPYLLDNLSNSTTEQFIEELSNNAACSNYYFTYIGSDKMKCNLSAMANRLGDILKKHIPHVQFSAYVFRGQDLHDRYLITNSCMINSGAGFDLSNKTGSIKKDTYWEIKKPWVIQGVGIGSQIVASTINEVLQSIKKGIQVNEAVIDCASPNPLLKL